MVRFPVNPMGLSPDVSSLAAVPQARDLSQERREIVYSAESRLRSPITFVREATHDLSRSRDLAWHLFVRNVRSRYRASALGYLWLLLPPAATAGVWVLLRASRIVAFESPLVPYPVFLISGLFLWQAFLKALLGPLQQLAAHRTLLTRIQFPSEALLLAAFAEAVFEVVLYLAVLAAVFIGFDVGLLWPMLLGLPAVLVLMLCGAAVGVLLAPWSLLYGDVQRGVNLAATWVFFLTPILYPMPAAGPLARLAAVNPVAILLGTCRDLLLTGGSPLMGSFLAVGAVLPVVLVGAWALYRLSLRHVVARL
jgi:lipopolysaccharide transport system permease protein